MQTTYSSSSDPEASRIRDPLVIFQVLPFLGVLDLHNYRLISKEWSQPIQRLVGGKILKIRKEVMSWVLTFGTSRQQKQLTAELTDREQTIICLLLYNARKVDREALKMQEGCADNSFLEASNLDELALRLSEPGQAILRSLSGSEEILISQGFERLYRIKLLCECDPYSQKGRELFELKEYETAIEAYDSIIELNPDHINAHFNKGLCLSALSKFQAAVPSYNKTIELALTCTKTQYLKDPVSTSLDNCKQALMACDQLIKLDPTDIRTYGYKAKLLHYFQQYDAALETYSEAEKQVTQFSGIISTSAPYYKKSLVLFKIKDQDIAVFINGKTVVQKSNPYFAKARVLAYLGQEEAAIRAFNIAMRGGRPSTLYNRFRFLLWTRFFDS